MKRYSPYFFLISLFLMISGCSESVKKTANDTVKKKIVLIPGKDSHDRGHHEHLGGCVLLADRLNKHVPGVHAVVTEQGWPKDTSILNDADAIVMFSDGGGRHMAIPHFPHLDRLMKEGVGLLNIHYAVEVPAGPSGNYFLDWIGGYFEIDWSVNPFWTLAVDSLPKHPVTNGVPPFKALDEWYYHMRFREDTLGIVPILKLHPPTYTLEREDGPHEGNPHVRAAIAKKEPQVMAWAYERPDGGRGFGFTGGHVHNNWKIDGYRKLVINAIAWIAKVDIPETGFDTTTPTQQELDDLRKKEK